MDSAPSPLTPREVVDEYFIENRTRLLEIAAFLDRLDRTDPSYAAADFRMLAFNEALAAVAQGKGRLERIQLLLSDPTTEPLGAWIEERLRGYDRGQRAEREASAFISCGGDPTALARSPGLRPVATRLAGVVQAATGRRRGIAWPSERRGWGPAQR